MEPTVFNGQLKSLFKYFRKPEKDWPDDETTVDWYERLKDMPDSAFRKAVSKLKDRDRLPFNIPKAVRDAWTEYLAHNPKKEYRKTDYRSCGDCGSTGIFNILVPREIGPGLISKIVFCSRCDNWERWGSDQSVQRISARELFEKNIPFLPGNRVAVPEKDENGHICGFRRFGHSKYKSGPEFTRCRELV